MCGPVDFTALGDSIVRLAALSLAGGAFLAAPEFKRLLEALRRRVDAEAARTETRSPCPRGR